MRVRCVHFAISACVLYLQIVQLKIHNTRDVIDFECAAAYSSKFIVHYSRQNDRQVGQARLGQTQIRMSHCPYTSLFDRNGRTHYANTNTALSATPPRIRTLT